MTMTNDREVTFTPTKINNQVGILTTGLSKHYGHPELFMVIPKQESGHDYTVDVATKGLKLKTVVEFLLENLMMFKAGDISTKGEYFTFVKGDEETHFLTAPFLFDPDFRLPTNERALVTMLEVDGKVVEEVKGKLNTHRYTLTIN